MKHIIVPTDFSENAIHALRYAIFVWEREECTFYLLNAYQTGPSNLQSIRNREKNTRLHRTIKKAAEKDLSNLLETVKLENDNSKHFFKTISVANSLISAIGQCILKYNADYIFMGTKGATGLKSVFLGSNTVDVISEIDYCPIVVVPMETSFKPLTEILFATGFEHIYNKYELNPMVRIAKLWNSKIRILHLLDEDREVYHKETAKEVISKRLYQLPHEVIEVEKKDKISSEIERAVAYNKDVGMVAMIHYWHSFIESLTREQVVKNVAFGTKVPFLVMHLPK